MLKYSYATFNPGIDGELYIRVALSGGPSFFNSSSNKNNSTDSRRCVLNENTRSCIELLRKAVVKEATISPVLKNCIHGRQIFCMGLFSSNEALFL